MRKLGWAGPSCARPSLSMLVVTINAERGEQMATALRTASRWNQWGRQPVVHVATDIEVVADYAARSPLSVEFVALMLEPGMTHGLQWARTTLRRLELDLLIGHVVLVDVTGTAPLDKAIPQDQFDNFRREYKLHLLRGDLDDRTEREHLADRVCLLFEQMMGLDTAIPNILRCVSS